MTKHAFSVVLTVREDSEMGGLGLSLPGMHHDGVNPSTGGLTVAHDLLEHQNGAESIGGIDDELEALGAIWYVRGQFGELRRDSVGSMYTIHQNIAGDVTRMFRDFFYGAEVATGARVALGSALPVADVDLREIITEARKGALGELDTEDKAEARAHMREYMRVCLPRMRAGYRKAAKRFKDARTANRLFWEIADAIDGAIGKRSRHNSASGIEHEGQQFTLEYSYDTVTGDTSAHCWESTYDDMPQDDEDTQDEE